MRQSRIGEIWKVEAHGQLKRTFQVWVTGSPVEILGDFEHLGHAQRRGEDFDRTEAARIERNGVLQRAASVEGYTFWLAVPDGAGGDVWELLRWTPIDGVMGLLPVLDRNELASPAVAAVSCAGIETLVNESGMAARLQNRRANRVNQRAGVDIKPPRVG